MKFLLKIILRIAAIIIIFTLLVFAVRWVNTNRYSEYISTDESSVYNDPANLTLYDTDQENMTVETIQEGNVNGFHLVPDDLKAEGVIVTFGGSDGSSNYDLAVMLANEGYEVYSLFFFGIGSLPDYIQEVPIDFFEDVLVYIEDTRQSEGPLTVLGASKGAELTLNLAAVYEEIDHIILYAPTAYNFFSLDQQNSDDSSWSYESEALPYLSSREGNLINTVKMMGGFMFNYPVAFKPVYDGVIEGTEVEKLEAARIKAEVFEGEGLMFAGGDDLMWDSAGMGEIINQEAGQITLYTYPEAGHLFTMGRYFGDSTGLVAMGGDEGANQNALEESNMILLDTLAGWHSAD